MIVAFADNFGYGAGEPRRSVRCVDSWPTGVGKKPDIIPTQDQGNRAGARGRLLPLGLRLEIVARSRGKCAGKRCVDDLVTIDCPRLCSYAAPFPSRLARPREQPPQWWLK
jgi:hypothetical protein